MSLGIHRKVSSMISQNEKEIKKIFVEYKTIEDIKDNKIIITNKLTEMIIQQKNFNTEELEKIKDYINRTIDYFVLNKAFGKGLLIGLKNILFDIYFLPCFPAVYPNIINRAKTTEVKNHSYKWFYNAYIENCNFCLNSNIIMPFKNYLKNGDVNFIESFKNIDEDAFFNFIKETFLLNEKDFISISTLFLYNPELFYVKTYIDKYFFGIKSKIDTAIEKAFKTPIGYFFVIKEKMLNDFYSQSKIFFYGKTKSFIELQTKIEKNTNIQHKYLKNDFFITIQENLKQKIQLKAKKLDFNNEFQTIIATNGLKGGDGGHGGRIYLAFLYQNGNINRKLKISQYIRFEHQIFKNATPISNKGSIELLGFGDWEFETIYKMANFVNKNLRNLEKNKGNFYKKKLFEDGEEFICIKTDIQPFIILGMSKLSKYKRKIYISIDINEELIFYILTSFGKRYFGIHHFEEYCNFLNGKLELIFKCDNLKSFDYLKESFLMIENFLKQIKDKK